jgi:hypothetical protein
LRDFVAKKVTAARIVRLDLHPFFQDKRTVLNLFAYGELLLFAEKEVAKSRCTGCRSLVLVMVAAKSRAKFIRTPKA